METLFAYFRPTLTDMAVDMNNCNAIFEVLRDNYN
jgi:hypothetical protein